jgi:succinate dehydrogenase hydrophobic anchor subunit
MHQHMMKMLRTVQLDYNLNHNIRSNLLLLLGQVLVLGLVLVLEQVLVLDQ